MENFEDLRKSQSAVEIAINTFFLGNLKSRRTQTGKQSTQSKNPGGHPWIFAGIDMTGHDHGNKV
jgi:hypothetical protein